MNLRRSAQTRGDPCLPVLFAVESLVGRILCFMTAAIAVGLPLAACPSPKDGCGSSGEYKVCDTFAKKCLPGPDAEAG
jgi:hypothetical protein